MNRLKHALERWSSFWATSGGVIRPARGGLLVALPGLLRHGISGSSGFGDEIITFGAIIGLMVVLAALLYLGRRRKKKDK